jgi:hypothetical protein
MLSISSLATLYVSVPVACDFDLSTLPGWPTAASVALAFVGPFPTVPQAATNVPTAFTTWYPASWVGTSARILLGPGGVVTLGVGCYQAWLKLDYLGQSEILWSGPLVVV